MDSTKGTIQKNIVFFCEEGSVCKRRFLFKKGEKTMFKPNRVFKKKKEIHKGPTENNIQEREQKRFFFKKKKHEKTKKGKIEKKKKRQNMQKLKKNMKQCPTKVNERTSCFF